MEPLRPLGGTLEEAAVGGVGVASATRQVPYRIHCVMQSSWLGAGVAELVLEELEGKVSVGRGPCLYWERKSGN